jgi:NitT/TauT family transport system permease protein
VPRDCATPLSELIGSDEGLGCYIQIVTGNMRPHLAFAGIFLLTLLGSRCSAW